jgi:drug/metabolite transporter (DMT)-like permease
MPKRFNCLPILALVLLSLAWGYTWVIAKIALSYVAPFNFAMQRSIGGAITLFAALILTRRSLRLAAPWPTVWVGMVQTGAFLFFQTWALVEGGAGKTAVLIFTMPIWTMLLAWTFLGERLRGMQWLAACFALAGLGLIIAPWDMQSSLFSKFLGVMAALSWAVGTVLIKRMRAKHQFDLFGMTAWQMAFGALFLIGAAMLSTEPPTQWTPTYIGILAFMCVVSTGLCWFLWFYVLDRLPAWEASLSILATPVIAMLSSHLQLAEDFSTAELSGIGLIGGGLTLLSLIGWLANRRRLG